MDAGIPLVRTAPVGAMGRFLLHRDHKKMVIADDVAFVAQAVAIDMVDVPGVLPLRDLERRREAPAEPWAVLVAHDGIFRLALLTLLGLPYERFWSFPFNLCAITALALNQGVATLRAHNLSEHLAPLAAEERAAAEARGDRRGAL